METERPNDIKERVAEICKKYGYDLETMAACASKSVSDELGLTDAWQKAALSLNAIGVLALNVKDLMAKPTDVPRIKNKSISAVERFLKVTGFQYTIVSDDPNTVTLQITKK